MSAGLLHGDNGTGSVEVIKPGGKAEVLRMTGRPGPVTSVSVTLSAKAIEGSSYPERALVDLRGFVHWGNGRSGGDAQIDVGRSTVFTVSAAWTLTVEVENVGRSVGITTGCTYRVEACAVYGGATATPAIKSDRLGQLVSGAETPRFMEVPAFARRVRIVTSESDKRRNMIVRFYSENNGGAVPLYESFQPQGDGGRDDPVINGAEFYKVLNLDSTDTLQSVIAVWELAL